MGPADQVFFEPLHPYTKILVGSNPEPDPRTERERASTTIAGEIPSPVNVPAGCRFANRCPEAMPECSTQTPQLIPVKQADDTKREVACHLYS